jgi:hypothetical protein
VQQIWDNWPESGRLRRAVSIETARTLVRPEFQAILTMVQTQQLLVLDFPTTHNNNMTTDDDDIDNDDDEDDDET